MYCDVSIFHRTVLHGWTAKDDCERALEECTLKPLSDE